MIFLAKQATVLFIFTISNINSFFFDINKGDERILPLFAIKIFMLKSVFYVPLMFLYPTQEGSVKESLGYLP